MGMDPYSWAMIGINLATQVAGGLESANAAGKAESQADDAADAALAQGEIEVGQINTQTEHELEQAAADARRSLARASVALTSAGVSPATGSALQILSGAAADARRDLAWLDYEGRLKASKARARAQSRANNYAARASSASSRQQSAYSSLLMNGGSSLLSLGSSAFGV